jgi:hypothetical protein
MLPQLGQLSRRDVAQPCSPARKIQNATPAATMPARALLRTGTDQAAGRGARRRRYDGTPRLYGTQEAAERLGVSRPYLSYMLAHKQVVKPVAQLACGPIWSESQLDEQLFLWRTGGPTRLDRLRVRQMTLARRLRVLEERWEALVRACADGETRKPVARWEGDAARTRRRKGRSALATRTEARRALTEAKLLRLVADLGDEDVVLSGVAQELGEIANLRKRLQTVQGHPQGAGPRGPGCRVARRHVMLLGTQSRLTPDRPVISFLQGFYG